MVTTICYGKKKEWATRKEATKFFTECALWSDGSEKERYMNILLELSIGNDICTDGVG